MGPRRLARGPMGLGSEWKKYSRSAPARGRPPGQDRGDAPRKRRNGGDVELPGREPAHRGSDPRSGMRDTQGAIDGDFQAAVDDGVPGPPDRSAARDSQAEVARRDAQPGEGMFGRVALRARKEPEAPQQLSLGSDEENTPAVDRGGRG